MADFNLAMEMAALYARGRSSSTLDQDLIDQINIILSARNVPQGHHQRSSQLPNETLSSVDQDSWLTRRTPEQETSYLHTPSEHKKKRPLGNRDSFGGQDTCSEQDALSSHESFIDQSKSTKPEDITYVACCLNALSL